jgi:hypothetical protein
MTSFCAPQAAAQIGKAIISIPMIRADMTCGPDLADTIGLFVSIWS